MRLFFFVIFSYSGCNVSNTDYHCSQVKEHAELQIRQWFIKDSSALRFNLNTWNQILDGFCDRTDSMSDLLMIKKENQTLGLQEGIIHLKGTSIYYYFKLSGGRCRIISQTNELSVIKRIMPAFENDFKGSQQRVLQAAPRTAISHASYFDFLYISFTKPKESGFFSVGYFPNMLEYLSKLE